jgi:anti-sigma B factor antagonist
MKSENPATSSGASSPQAPSVASHKSDKKLKLSLETENSGGAVVLHCQGRMIFCSEARELSTIVAEVLPSAGRMVVDLAGVDWVDSGGLGELVVIHMWAEAAGYSLKFASPRKSVRHLFEVTNLVSVFDVYASVPEAIAATAQEAGAKALANFTGLTRP